MMKPPRNFMDLPTDARTAWSMTMALMEAVERLASGDITAAFCRCNRKVFDQALGWDEFSQRIFKGTADGDRRFAQAQIRIEVTDTYPSSLWSIDYLRGPQS